MCASDDSLNQVSAAAIASCYMWFPHAYSQMSSNVSWYWMSADISSDMCRSDGLYRHLYTAYGEYLSTADRDSLSGVLMSER